MKHLTKTILLAALCLAALLCASGCSAEKTPYEVNNDQQYNISVKYDANGGIFTTNTSVIVDSYNLAELAKNANGKAEIALLSPDNAARGNDAFSAIKNGYFLAGWYAVRNEVAGGEADAYTYADRWDFAADRLEVDPNGTYSAETPVLTLYAAWVPLFEVEFYDRASGELISTLTLDPTVKQTVTLPAWSTETGAIDMHDFPEKKGYTFASVSTDASGEQVLEGETFTHPGKLNTENGSAEQSVAKLYIDWTEGEWYRIYTAEQLSDNASLTGHYEICADLDFTDEIWPTSFMYGNFSGEIKGNGYTFKNITVSQTNNSKVNAGLFGHLTEDASITDLTLENVTFTIEKGTRVTGASFGLLAGTISKDAALDGVAIKNSTLQIDSGCYFGVTDYSIGLVCGMGDDSVIETAEITCVSTGENPDSVKITTDGNTVTVEFVS
ncbi:MAG: hypothetical protein IJD82_01695 [Clostridia bacterium]|nr:hypothetical protein [Clostridia bacterium]